ncbi:MAG: hypothetical protein EOO38_03130 [Cytophagaceae bacterium]|jgi:hypothetical protein|nr:MAG: hypothetical protein EOO38_03130 [Cytophagaceae bacterium]
MRINEDLTKLLRCASQVSVENEKALSNSIGLLCEAAAMLLEPEQLRLRKAYEDGRSEAFGTSLHILACNTPQESRRLIVGMRRDIQRRINETDLGARPANSISA